MPELTEQEQQKLIDFFSDQRVADGSRDLSLVSLVNEQDENGWTALMFACAEDREDIVEILVSIDGINLDLQNKKGDRAVNIADENKNGSILQILAEHDANMDGTEYQAEIDNEYANECWEYIQDAIKDGGDIEDIKHYYKTMEDAWDWDREWRDCQEKMTKLALEHSNVEAFDFLRNKMSHPYKFDIDDFVSADTKMKEYFFEQGFKLDEWTVDDILTEAITYDEIENVELYAKYGLCNSVFVLLKAFGVNDERDWKEPQMEIFLMLLSHIKDIREKDEQGRNILMRVINECECINPYVIDMLIEKGIKLDDIDKASMTALMYCGGEEGSPCINIASKILEYETNLQAQDKNEKTALMYFCKNGAKECDDTIKEIMNNCADNHLKDINGNDALYYALCNSTGNVDIVKLLLEQGFVLPEDGGGIITASSVGNDAIIDRIIKIYPMKIKDYINVKDKNGETALVQAVKNGHLSTVKKLLELGADINVKNKDGDTLLNIASENHSEFIFYHLLKNHCQINEKDMGYINTLFVKEISPISKTEEVDLIKIKMLMENNADINIRDSYDRTFLMRASGIGYNSLIKLFIEFDANPSLKDADGKTALDYAKSKSIGENTLELLKNYENRRLLEKNIIQVANEDYLFSI